MTYKKIRKEGVRVVPETFHVCVERMVESHRITWWVALYRGDRSEDAKIWDDNGRITPYYTEIKSQADETAEDWAEFLGVEVTHYVEPDEEKEDPLGR